MSNLGVMTYAETLRDLAARCAQAEGPSRELDARIHAAINGFIPPEWRCEFAEGDSDYVAWKGDARALCCADKHFTSNIDDAATVRFEEDWEWEVHGGGTQGGGYATVRNHVGVIEHDAQAATPALALCSAALSARVFCQEWADQIFAGEARNQAELQKTKEQG